MFETMHEYQARFAEQAARSATPPSDRLKHAAAIAIRYFSRPLITLDDVVQVEGDEVGSVTVREALEWVRSAEGQAVLAQEPFGLREQLVDFANRMLDSN